MARFIPPEAVHFPPARLLLPGAKRSRGIAQPTTIADDTGSDFYCTIFDILKTNPPSVEPRTSFAIQIKSNARTITAHNKVQSLFHLEIPYFIGVVKLATAELKIYSGEWFPMMTAKFGVPAVAFTAAINIVIAVMVFIVPPSAFRPSLGDAMDR